MDFRPSQTLRTFYIEVSRLQQLFTQNAYTNRVVFYGIQFHEDGILCLLFGQF
jgi:hypothetical protein